MHLARNRHVQSLPSKRDVKKKPRLDALPRATPFPKPPPRYGVIKEL
ncbi:hypothetical protein WCP94_002349 [Bilophila wadsworthia]